MIFEATPLAGAFLVDLERQDDSGDFFARSYCVDEFEAAGLATEWPQCNVCFSARKGTLRGLHYNAEPYGEARLVRCTMGAVYEVIVDLRPDSDSTLSWIGVELDARSRRGLYVPAGFAHGFITLSDDCEVLCQTSNRQAPLAARGLRYDDPALGVRWPVPVGVVSRRDRCFPDLDVREFLGVLP